MEKDNVIIFIDEETISQEELLEGDTYDAINETV